MKAIQWSVAPEGEATATVDGLQVVLEPPLVGLCWNWYVLGDNLGEPVARGMARDFESAAWAALGSLPGQESAEREYINYWAPA